MIWFRLLCVEMLLGIEIRLLRMMKRRNLILGWKNEALMCSHNGALLLMACLLVKKKLKSMPHSLVKYT